MDESPRIAPQGAAGRHGNGWEAAACGAPSAKAKGDSELAKTAWKKNMETELRIEDMGADGEGIGKREGAVFFVKGAVIGDRVRARITKMKKDFGYAKVMEVLEPSPYRVEPRCGISRQCGGCQIQELDYRKQLEYKERKLRDCLRRIGGFSTEGAGDGAGHIRVSPILGMEEPYFYRNKAQFPIGLDRDGRVVAGFYAARTHQIMPSQRCVLGDRANEEVLGAVISYMEDWGVPPYDEASGKGLVRHVLIRVGFRTKEIMACVVANGRSLPHAGDLIRRLRSIEGMASIVLNVNEEDTNVILGRETICLWGRGYLMDCIGGIRYRISPLSFYQVNPVQTEKLYGCVQRLAGLSGNEVVWDLYCGIGTISLFLAKRTGRVYGVEISHDAIEDARQNARLNGIGNVEFLEGRAEDVLPEFYEKMAAGGEAQEEAARREETTPFISRKGLEADGKAATCAAGGEAETLVARGVEAPAARDEVLAAGGEAPAARAGMPRPDVIVVDPPRKGCDVKCLDTILKVRPGRVIYVSCNPATLARDLKYLCAGGFELKEVQPVDMFPHTVHVETVVLMSRVRD